MRPDVGLMMYQLIWARRGINIWFVLVKPDQVPFQHIGPIEEIIYASYKSVYYFPFSIATPTKHGNLVQLEVVLQVTPSRFN